MELEARCRTTAMGIMPHSDVDKALELALGLDVPFWPQLPNVSFYEDMYAQASENNIKKQTGMEESRVEKGSGFSTDVLEGSETQGQMLLDTSILSTALENDPDAVASLFSGYFDGVTDSSQIRFASSLPTATPGVYDVEIDLNRISLGRPLTYRL